MMDFKAIKLGLQNNIAHLARELAPGGYVKNHNYFAESPLRFDKNIGSFYIGLEERRTFQRGAWIDHKTGEKGDIIDLICKVKGVDKVEAFRWGAQWLGQDFTQKTLPQDSQPAYNSSKKRNDQSDDEKAASAAAWFARAKPVAGTIGDIYLKSRGLGYSHYPACLGFFEAVKHPSGGAWPCLMTALTDTHNQIRAVHRTFLARDGKGKAAVDPPRLVWPGYKGCIMRLHKTDESHDLALVEGVEDGLSVAKAKPDVNVWGAVAVKNFQNITLPAILGTLYICADNDLVGSDGSRALDKAIEVLLPEVKRRGATMKVVRSPVGKDFNDIY